MSGKKYILQGVTDDNHYANVIDLLRIPKPEEIVISTAFMTEGGLLQIGDVLSLVKSKSIIIAGIRNGITSAQALKKSLAIGCKTYVSELLNNHKDNVFSINKKKINNLLKSGCVIDEDLKRPGNPIGTSKDRSLDTIPRMVLKIHSPVVKIKKAVKKSKPTGSKKKEPGKKSTKSQLVWKNNPLTERDLTVPSGANTNQTGSMLFTKGQLEDIDQRHYFRDEVFAGLNWQPDQNPQKAHLERTEA